MDINELLYDLEVAIEGINYDASSAAKALTRQMSDEISSAKKAIKKGNYTEAENICNRCIAQLNKIKTELQKAEKESSMTKLDDLVKGNLGDIVAGNLTEQYKGVAKELLALVAVCAAGFLATMPTRLKVTKNAGVINELERERSKNHADDMADMQREFADFHVTDHFSNEYREKERIKAHAKADRNADLRKRKEVAEDELNKAVRTHGKVSSLVMLAQIPAFAAIAHKSIKFQIECVRNNLNFKNMTYPKMYELIDHQIKTFEAIKETCKSIGSNRVAKEAIESFYLGAYEALLNDGNGIIPTLVACGFTDDEIIATVYDM